MSKRYQENKGNQMTANHTEESTSRFIQTDKWKIHVSEAGEGHPIIMMHGTGPGATGWSNFHQNLKVLAAKHRVIAWDAPGWGKSDPVGPDLWQAFPGGAHVEALKQMLDARGFEQAALVGNSMGGGTALAFAAHYPERVSHLITMGSGLQAPNLFTPKGLEGGKVIFETYRDPTPENFRRLVKVMVYDDSFATDALMQQRSEAALANPEHLKNWLEIRKDGFRPGATFTELVSKLSSFDKPALFIHGRDDKVVSFESSLRALAVVPNSRATIINRCGHWAQVEHAGEFNALVDSFVSGSAEGETGSTDGFGG